MSLSDIFKVFSRRNVNDPSQEKQLTPEFKRRVFLRCRDLFYGSDFWNEIHTKFTYLLGKYQLTELSTGSPGEDAVEFLHRCSDENFLDFIEYIFTTQAYFHASSRGELVKEINEFLLLDDLPYALTDFVYTEGHDGQYQTMTLTSLPQVVKKESEVVFQTAIEPALNLLRDSRFTTPNKEFLKALEDYRKADYGDCLIKCGSAFESVLKIVCDYNNWPFKQTDTASPLLKTVISNTNLESFFEQPLILIATLRNKLSNAHGAETGSRNVSKGKAEYTINATASAILLVVNEAI